ncbi:MAG TPA: hypothetical protein VFV78_06330 [Vicinamibacterales bacterium]|nr:hypothetical protein [Vicinamibacterales bacterium]
MRMIRSVPWAVAVVMMVSAGLVSARQGGFNGHDDFTEYNLLDPASHQFHIVYYLNQRQAGATTLLNQTRSGSEGSDISVSDPQTGAPLAFEYKSGAELSAAGESARLAADEHYIRAFLPRPVPEGGEGRVRIEKTYFDDKSYYTQGEEIVFARSLGIGRNAIVLPKGYVAGSSNVAAQMTATTDGRVKFTFENINGYASDVQIRGRKSAAVVSVSYPVVERAFDFTKTLYDLGDPAKHEVVLRHEYVETRAGSKSVPPWLARHTLQGLAVTDMDTGKPLMAAPSGSTWSVALASPITNDRQSAHIRIAGREIDAKYRIEGGQLAWQLAMMEPRATVLLPAGWEPTAVSVPATVATGRDGRVAIQLYNGRVDPLVVDIRAVRAGR